VTPVGVITAVGHDGAMTLAAHLASLDVAALTDVLARRPDVLVEPAPRDVAELADRLGGVLSLGRALAAMDADEVTVARVLALTGAGTVAELAAALPAEVGEVDAVVTRLAGRALAWRDGERIGLPERLANEFTAEIDRFRTIRQIATYVRVDDLRDAVGGLGGDPSGTKSQVIETLVALMADRHRVLDAITGLAPGPRRYLAQLLEFDRFGYLGNGYAESRAVVAAGLAMPTGGYGLELPREVVAAVLLAEPALLTGHPAIPAAEGEQDSGRAGADGTVLAVTALLDEAASIPLAELKKGGIGARERKRLAGRLGLDQPALTIDVAAALHLLESRPDGFVPAAAYAGWRDAPVAARWAGLARAWFDLDWAPTHRDTDDGEVAPPVPLESAAGMVRRALLCAAAGGRSLDAVAAVIGWFAPLAGDGSAAAVAAARREGELLGLVAGERLTALGELLVASGDLAADAAPLLPESRGRLVLQSDLSAVVSGQASAAGAQVLAAAAAPEGHGAAATWRFSPSSIRAALDAGWTADVLRAELLAAAGRELPQPLDYLIGDVARRHGTVRVRETRCCVTGSEAETAEILHTRGLARLDLRRIAPTVLTSPASPDAVLAALRKAGFLPMPEDADGVVTVASRAALPEDGDSGRAPDVPVRLRGRRRLDAADVAARVLRRLSTAAGTGGESTLGAQLALFNPRLDSAEVALLIDALETGRSVRIVYRNSAGNRSVRDVLPFQMWDRFLRSYCFLRSGDRDFAVDGIEAVSPAG
jgi:Helicase conserved C-terminal domain